MPGVQAGRGTFIAVVGPSGAGKDTVLRGAMTALAGDVRFVFARRVITRNAGAYEAHDTLSPDAFLHKEEDGAFMLAWNANGLSYGLAASLAVELEAGRHIVANISRSMIDVVRARFQPSFIIEIAASPDILLHRLATRGREDAVMLSARLERASIPALAITPDARIDNNAAPEIAVAAFLDILNHIHTAGWANG